MVLPRKRKRVFDVLEQRPYGVASAADLHTASKDCAGFVERLALCHRLPVHTGCVNSIWWNTAGTLLLSGSDDHHLKLTEPYTARIVVDHQTAHRANIFSAKFLPFSNDSKIVSCSGDGAVLYTDLQDLPCVSAGRPPQLYLCPAGTTYEVLTWDSEPHCFLSCGEEGAVRSYDLRQHRACSVRGCTETVLLWADRAVTTMALNPASVWELAVATADGAVSLYDRRMVQPQQNGGAIRQWTAPDFQGTGRRITALKYATGGRELLVSYSAGDIYLFDLAETETSSEPAAAAAQPARPPVKRLRLRGDWSDTGPQARPERMGAATGGGEREGDAEEGGAPTEQGAEEDRPRRSGVSLHANLINQMSDVLQRLLTSEMPSRPTGVTPAPARPPPPPPDLSRRPVTRRVMERIRQRRALNMEQVVQGMESLQTSSDPSEPNQTSDDVTTEPANGAEVGSSPAEAGEELPDAGGAITDTAGAAGENCVVQAEVQTSTVAVDEKNSAEHDASQETGSRDRSEGVADEVARRTVSGNEGARSGSADTSAATDTTSGSAPDDTSSADDATDGPTGTDGAAVAVSTSDDTVPTPEAPSPLGSYLEAQPVAPRSEPLVSLYYNPQSSTAGQISVGGPESASSGLPQPPETEPRHATYAERALLLSCGSAQEPDRADPDDPDDQEAAGGACSGSGTGSGRQQPRVVGRYTGHRNARTMIKEANFWGSDHVLSGSDCGHVFIWNRHTGRLVAVLEADRHVVNCVQPHPLDPLLATSGIDYDVKLWAPLAPHSTLDEQRAQELMTRNAIMLEETRDTITVPASFMIRMLASLSNRRGR
ncbi:DDB1- and CUL4-associated factor 6-like [Amphibalanus amphitrite]|uniref:DDB1- and CUL4-associated factor 6-like n=1 Tax=Amphibalanus amphitrite TaxID=1232801 RepID=UPI001C900498|nr:DDB1- and CUL4-associated factor 6-like [Amphibalanus amphitrite]XP_043242893.1 DDB1- and CUL4-associated factor 6-like [Amphibalanus amphitrite]XP_043242894.1 DDB1- and CUL4-associated factor 6-like [Amphibalanus amphitrite]